MPSFSKDSANISSEVGNAVDKARESGMSEVTNTPITKDTINKVMNTLNSVQETASTVRNTITGAITGASSFFDNGLRRIYDNAKDVNKNALLNEYIAEQNLIINEQGSTKYDDLLINRYTAQGKKDLEELNNKNIELTNLLVDLINVTQQQSIGYENMKKVFENLEEKNKQLSLIIYGSKGDLYTYNRKSMYESKLKQNVENWTIIPELIYWTLVILWVCIVMLYLRNVTFVSVAILIGLILYPYFSTPIYLWVLDKIQYIWNFIFIAVHNRISV